MTDKLIEGFRRFRAEHYGGADALMPRLAEQGQNPDYFIIACMDSRSLPGIIFKQPPGSFFTHTPPGAIVRPYKQGTALAAALQFALAHNEVKEIILLGHTGCGAIKALVDNIDDEEISSFVDVAQTGLKRARDKYASEHHHDDLYRHAEEEIVLQSAHNLKSYPSVAKALKEGRVTINAWLFDMESGNLFAWDEAQVRFLPITDHP